jgi:hypothetical protein
MLQLSLLELFAHLFKANLEKCLRVCLLHLLHLNQRLQQMVVLPQLTLQMHEGRLALLSWSRNRAYLSEGVQAMMFAMGDLLMFSEFVVVGE